MHLTLRQLTIFEAAARHGSLTRAGEELHLTQPAVSMQVKQLEEALGLPLFDRIGKKLRLTEAGNELRRHSREITQQVEAIAQAMDDLRGLKRGSLRIAVATTVGHYATHAIAEFHKLHPGITVSLDITNFKSLSRQLQTNEVDIVLMGFPPKNKQLEAVPFMENPLVVIAADAHPLGNRKAINLGEIAKQPMILREAGSGTRRAIERYFSSKKLELHTALFMSSNEAIKQAVEAGLGIAVVSIHTIGLELKAKRLRTLPVRGFPLRRKWYVVNRHDKHLSVAARAFKDFVLSGSVTFPAPVSGHIPLSS